MTGTTFYIVSKFVGLLIRGETWLLLLLAATLFAQWRGARRSAALGLSLTFASLFVLTLVPVGFWAIAPLERQYPLNPPLDAAPDGIVVLGGGVEPLTWKETGIVHVNDAGDRLTEAAILARRYPKARILLSGGGATLSPLGDDLPSEAAMTAAFLTGVGVDPARLLIEGLSRNTAGNAELSLQLVQPGDGQSWLLLTSAAHMPRAMAAFRRAGWTGLTAWPVDLSEPPSGTGLIWDLPANLYFLNRAVKEYVGILAYELASRS